MLFREQGRFTLLLEKLQLLENGQIFHECEIAQVLASSTDSHFSSVCSLLAISGSRSHLLTI